MKTVAKIKESFQIIDISGKIIFKSPGFPLLSSPTHLPPISQAAVVKMEE